MTTLTITKQPTYRLGSSNGIKVQGTVRTDDLQVNDDAIVAGDLEVTGTIYGTLVGGVTTATDHLTASITVDAGKDITAAAGDSDINYAVSTGTIDTPSGANRLNGHVTIAAAKNLAMSGASTVTTGTGAIALNGDVTLAATKGITKTAGIGAIDFSAGTGIFKSTTGANTLGGDVEIADGKNFVQTGAGTFATGSGANGLNGDITIAKGKHITVGVGGGQGAGKVEFLSTGIFTSPSGANTLMGDVTINGTKTFTTGTGAVTIKGAPTIDANLDLVMGTAGSGTGGIKTGTGAIALNGSVTVATAKTLNLTDADSLIIAGKIMPQYRIINVPINANSVDQWVFVADAAYELDSVELAFTVTSTSGTFDLKKSTSVQAPASGGTMLTGTVDLATTANTVYAGTKHATEGNRRLADGNKLSVCFTGTMTGLAGGVATIRLFRV
jgi:fibronectin-binding autotransporter adhesin